MHTGNLDGQGIAELRGYKFPNLSSAPTTNVYEGRFYMNTTDHILYVYNGSQWVDALSQGRVYIAGLGIDSTALSNGTVQVSTTIASKTDIHDGKVIYQKNGTAFATISVNQTATTTVNYTIPTTASDVGALPDTTTIGAANTIVKVDGSTVGTINANATSDSTISITATSGISIASSSTDYLTYSSGAIGAKVDGTVTASSTNLITSGAVDTAINNALVGGVKYVGTWTATSQTNYSGITLPVKKGYMYLVEGSATITAGGTTIEWNSGDYLMVNADVASGGTLTNVSKIDNTEASDIVRLNATQTLTNKTIDADDNTISDLTTSNLKSGVLQTTIRTTTTATDATLPSELAVAKALNGKQDVLTPGSNISISGGTISATDTIYTLPIAGTSTLGGVKVGNNLTIASDGTLSAVPQGITIDTTLSASSTNPVQNKVITSALAEKSSVTFVDWTV